MTVKFGDVILRQELYQEIIKHLTTSLLWRFYDVILYFRLCSGKKRVKNPNFFVSYLICLKFDIGGNFEMLITKSKPKLKLENDFQDHIYIFYIYVILFYFILFCLYSGYVKTNFHSIILDSSMSEA